MKTPEQCICEAILSGNESMIKKSYDACKGKVVAFLKKKGLGRTGARLAEDFYNDAWTEFLIKVATGKNGFSSANLNLTNFLIGISYNMARNAKRKDCKMTYFDDFEGAEAQYEAPIMEIFGQLDREWQLKQALSKLQPIYHEVVELTYYEKLTDDQIARRLEIMPSTVRKRRERAKKMLHETMLTPSQPSTEKEFNYYQGILKALEKNENTENQDHSSEGVTSLEEGVPAKSVHRGANERRRRYRGPSGAYLARRRTPQKVRGADQEPCHPIPATAVTGFPKPDGQDPSTIVRIIRKIWSAIWTVAASFLLIAWVGGGMLAEQPFMKGKLLAAEAATFTPVAVAPMAAPPAQQESVPQMCIPGMLPMNAADIRKTYLQVAKMTCRILLGH